MGRALAGDEFYSCDACAKAPFRLVQLGHDEPPTFPWTENLLTGERLELCPLRQLQLASDELRSEVLRWKHTYYPLYQKGQMLVPGGISAQPARWLAAMLYLDELSAQMERKFTELNKSESAS